MDDRKEIDQEDLAQRALTSICPNARLGPECKKYFKKAALFSAITMAEREGGRMNEISDLPGLRILFYRPGIFGADYCFNAICNKKDTLAEMHCRCPASELGSCPYKGK